MSKLNTYFEKKRTLDRLSEELRELEESKDLEREFEIVEKLKSMMSDYGISAGYLNGLLGQIDPSITKPSKSGASSKESTQGGHKRRLMRFENPHTGEVVETRGGNHSVLKKWRLEYGKETVNSWKKVVE